MSAVDKWFGAGLDRRTKSYGLAVWRFGSRLASGYIGRKCSAWHFDVRQWRANTSQLRKEILVSAASKQLSMPMPSAPKGRERFSKVNGKIREVSKRFAASAEAVRNEAVLGLSAKRKSLPAWLFYDATGSGLFEKITELPEYYPTRTERALLARYSDAACENIHQRIPGVTVLLQVSNYVTEQIRIERHAGNRILALCIGSNIGNFLPDERIRILQSLRDALEPEEGLLLGTDLAPGQHKSLCELFAAYDDSEGVTAKFNLNLLTRLNREIGTDFNPSLFRHLIRWNAAESRIEMHLESLVQQEVTMPDGLDGMELRIRFDKGETIHIENSYKFNTGPINEMLTASGFSVMKLWTDPLQTFAVTLAAAR
jgi:L-histidine Nalpha-methyltransferase